ncbi:FAD-dependent oxidoreductase [Streptomyces sp. 205]|uniref:FAD-dependent oxidoreductase n=2 Tax=Streptomyces coffeae TaxID=621382 RepID=A0ABS1NCG3_9ACTN|nr:FAD-dependent oxidoreductase [Streptomyces coffeae]
MDNGRELPYDRLVYALGSRTADPGERAFTPETAAEPHKRLLDGPGELSVVGGGLTGLEPAAEVAETQREWRVRLVTGGAIGPGLSPKGRAHARATLTGIGVRIEESRTVARPEDLGSDAVVRAACHGRWSLGRPGGLIQAVRADDSPRDVVLRGGMAARVKEQVVRSTIHLLRPAARRPGAFAHLPGFG